MPHEPPWLTERGYRIGAAISRFASTLDGLRGGYLMDPAFGTTAARDRIWRREGTTWRLHIRHANVIAPRSDTR